MKTTVQKLSVLLLVLILCFNISAAVSNELYPTSDRFVVSGGEKIEIPISIKNNFGFMGFRITVNYPSAVLINPQVRKGASLNTGNLLNSIGKNTDGSFDILWNDSENFRNNGELFVLSFDVKDDAKDGNYQIHFNYNPDDTFDENWNDVRLCFTDIQICVCKDKDDSFLSPIHKLISFIKNTFNKILEMLRMKEEI